MGAVWASGRQPETSGRQYQKPRQSRLAPWGRRLKMGYRNASFLHLDPLNVRGADMPPLPFDTLATPPGGGISISFDYLSDTNIAALIASGWIFTGGDPA